MEISEKIGQLSSFSSPLHVALIGAGGGIGSAMLEHLLGDPSVGLVHGFARRPLEKSHDKLVSGFIDLEDETSIRLAAEKVGAPLHLIIVATGLLHDGDYQPEKALKEITSSRLQRAFAVNATGPALVGKHFLPLVPREGKAVFAALSARVGSISGNEVGGWYGYRASKAALNMVLKNMAIEARRRYPALIITGLQPGTVDTPLSKPFQSGVRRDTLFTPSFAAGKLLQVIDQLEPKDSGALFDWAGERFDP